MRQKVFILGASGKVGRTLLERIATNDAPELEEHVNPTSVMGVANSTGYHFEKGGFSAERLRQLSQDRTEIEALLRAGHPMKKPTDILETARRLGYDGELVWVDVTAAREAMTEMHLAIIRNTRDRMVTANKNPLSLEPPEVYEELTRDPTRYRHSATAMAGLGAIPRISKRATIGDRTHEMRASLSGTLGFIADRLTQGLPLSEAIRQAINEGFTEPDFRDDLNGLDVARKLVILAREAGHRVNIGDVKRERFLPDEYFEIPDATQCLEAIRDRFDGPMKERYASAKARENTLKYLASFILRPGADRPELQVGFVEVPLDSAFGLLAGTDNRIEWRTDTYKPGQIGSTTGLWKLEGPGAGLDHTASVIQEDLVDLQPSVSRQRLK